MVLLELPNAICKECFMFFANTLDVYESEEVDRLEIHRVLKLENGICWKLKEM
jgi:hypothetical protein